MNQIISGSGFVAVHRDAHNGLHIRPTLPVADRQLLDYIQKVCAQEVLQNSKRQINQQTSAIWVYLSQSNLHLVGQLVAKEFLIHSGIGTSITLNKWIASKKNLIPPFSVFYVGCGAVLIKDNCIFMVQEKSGDRKGKYNIPGGRADPGQIISQCAERQLYEQTNIKAKFKCILHFRQITHYIYNCVDAYFACLMDFTPHDLQHLKLCQRELAGYRWVPLEQYEQFTQKNSSKTQQMLAKYIVKLWKNGCDFGQNFSPLIRSKMQVLKINENQSKKMIYHEPVYTKLQ